MKIIKKEDSTIHRVKLIGLKKTPEAADQDLEFTLFVHLYEDAGNPTIAILLVDEKGSNFQVEMDDCLDLKSIPKAVTFSTLIIEMIRENVGHILAVFAAPFARLTCKKIKEEEGDRVLFTLKIGRRFRTEATVSLDTVKDFLIPT